MKLRMQALCFLSAIGACLVGQDKSPSLTNPSAQTSVRAEALRLIRQDAKESHRDNKSGDATPAAPSDNNTLILEPIIVREKQVAPLPPAPPSETKLQEFFRTGTIYQNRQGTIRLWASGDQGLMLSFPF